MSLGGYVAIFSGEYAQFPEQLVDEFLAPGQRREPMAARNWYLTDSEWPLFLIKYAAHDPAARRGALEVSRDCVEFLREVDPLRTRADALLGIYDRVLESPHLLEFHLAVPLSRRSPGCGGSRCSARPSWPCCPRSAAGARHCAGRTPGSRPRTIT